MDFPRVAVDPNPGEGLERMVEAVIGGAITENRALAELASPIYQVHPVAPPHLFVHGMEDPVVPAYHSASLHEKLLQHSISSELHLMPGYGHNLDSPETAAVVDAFFNRHLR
jgi:dipeptidyl aminopeptidase/acylaminoacyl peptidase